jgi:thymidylate synthase (FAD)
MKTEIVHGIAYTHPIVTLLHASPLVNAELAGRTCYNSFENSEHEQVRNFNGESIEDIEHSDLLDSLCHVYHHMSIAEHANLTYLVKGTSRGVLQEHARHRIQAISVRSTRYTMSSVINAFVSSLFVTDGTSFIDDGTSMQMFASKVKAMDLFVVTSNDYLNIEIETIYKKLFLQMDAIAEQDIHKRRQEFFELAISKSSLGYLEQAKRYTIDAYELFDLLEAGKKKRNVGDAFKHIVTDNWKVDMVVTMNLRALKNYFQLRDSGAAYFQIQWLAEEMKKVTPKKYLDLIIRGAK